MAKLSSVQKFGENMLTVLENLRKSREEREQFNYRMSFENRQLNLIDKYRQQTLAQDQAQFETQEDRQRQESIGRLIGQGFRPIQEGFVVGRKNERTGEFQTDEPVFDYLGEKLAYPLTGEKPITQSRLKPIMGGLIEEQYQTGAEGETITGYENLFSPDRSSGSGAGVPEPFVEKPLLQWQVEKGLNYLQNPSYTKEVKDGNDVKKVPLTTDELKTGLDDAMNNLSSGYLDSATRLWLTGIQKQYGRYPNPDELRDEIVQSGEAKELTEDQLRRLSSFLNVYYQSYGGVKEMQKRIINPKSYDIE